MGWIVFYVVGLIAIIMLMAGSTELKPHWLIGIVGVAWLLLKSIVDYARQRGASGGVGRPLTAAGRAAQAERAAAALQLESRQTKALVFIYEHNSMTLEDFARLCPEADRPSLDQDLQALVKLGLMISKDDKFVMT